MLYELYVNQQLPMHKIASKLNIAIGSVYKYLKLNDIKTRDQKSTFNFIGGKLSEEAKQKISNFHKGKTVSLETRLKIAEAKYGIRTNNKWNGHTKVKSKGYIAVYKPEHPYCTCDGYVFEHRLVMEKILGRYLETNEIVHHINNNRKDNRPENLMIFKSNSDHQKYHNYFRKEVKKYECK